MKKATKKKPAVKRKPSVEFALVLRTCESDMTSHNGFRWPESGKVECPDWNPRAACGNGLHGLLWGKGDAGYLSWSDSSKWLVVRVAVPDVVVIDEGKVKFSRGTVVCCGDRALALAYIQEHAPNYQGVGAKSTAGDRGQATAGYSGQATAGDSGQATAGYRGQARAGIYGTIIVRWWDDPASRYRAEIGYVGETIDAAGASLKPNVFYRLDDQHRFVEVKA